MYYVVEIQDYGAGEGALLYFTYTDKNEAFSKYHTVLSFAATSNVAVHTCIIVDSAGQYIARESFSHVQEEVTPDENSES